MLEKIKQKKAEKKRVHNQAHLSERGSRRLKAPFGGVAVEVALEPER